VEHEALGPEPAQAPASESANAPSTTPGPGGSLTPAGVLALQQGAGNAAVAGLLQRQSVQTPSGAYVGDKGGATNNLREEVLPVMDRLHMLWSMTNDEYNAEYPNVAKEPARTAIDPGKLPKTIASLKRNEEPLVDPPVAQQFLGAKLGAKVGRGQANAKDDVRSLQDGLKGNGVLDPADYFTEHAVEPDSPGKGLDDAKIPKTIAAIGSFKAKAAAGTLRQDVFAGVKPVTADQHTAVEAILAGPGATVVGGKVKLPDPMKGAGKGGKFERALLKALDKYISRGSKAYQAQKKKGPSFPTASANDIAVAAQQEVERYFAPYIKVASRQPGDKFHPGAYSLVSKLGDQSTRPLGDPDRMAWLDYFSTTVGYGIREVLDRFRCLPSQRTGDSAEYVRVVTQYLNAGTHRSEVDDVIHSWPAEAGTGTVFLSPYVDLPDATAERHHRWETFTTLIHEMMHILEHPNFGETANRIGKPAGTILTEGFAEVMRTDLWAGPGNLVNRLGTPELAGLREKVEGSKQPYDKSAVVDAPYYDEFKDAKAIVAKVGMENAKAAFFLGHTELLGLGQGTASKTPLTDVAQWTDKDADTADTYEVKVAETETDVRTKTKGTKVIDSGGKDVPSGAALKVGDKVRVPGLSSVWVIEGDTFGSIAKQHDIGLPELLVANGFPPATKATDKPLVGSRLLIPIHSPVSP
jgi:hypothetical protein